MIRRPPRSTQSRSSAASDVYKRQAKYVVKILTGELRIGLREGLLEAAIAEAFDYPQPVVSMALMLTGDTGETAVLAREERLHEARLCLLHPIKFMLASPSEDAAAIMSRLGPTVWVEDKYDGIRAQLHRRGSDVRLYSRDLHDLSLIHISEPTRLGMISYAVFCLK